VTLHAKMAIPDSQRYPLKFYLLKIELELLTYGILYPMMFNMQTLSNLKSEV